MNNKKSLNDNLINIINTVLLILIIGIIIFSIFLWKETGEVIYPILGVICGLGILVNIYFLLKEKYGKKE